MSSAHATPVEEYSFLLHDVLGVDQREDIAGFTELSPDLTTQILEGISDFATDVLLPLNAVGDEHGCKLENGVVRTPPGFAEAYRAYCEAGWHQLGANETYGGTDLPGVLTIAVSEIVSTANSAFGLYPGLTRGAMHSIERAGEDWMREHVVPKMVSGEWSGTMCLTEPHCGTDLKLMTTKAVQAEDGTWRITGTKIFISGGDHDMADNIVHLVLAKTPGPDGQYVDDLATVALFMVPKMLVGTDGKLDGRANGVVCSGLEKKMGIKGSSTCVLNFEGSVGWKLGSTKKNAAADSKSSGMSAMFDMMNHARLGTGVQANAVAAAAYSKSANYARERVSGRAADPENRTAGKADPIIVHPDVRRMLLKQASFIEGARALALWVSLHLDIAARGEDPDERSAALARGSFLTPVVKAFFSDRGFESSNLAVQVYGGHGYIRENGVEQHVRDGRILQLYEGANGIQALDLVARKLPAGNGAALRALIEEITAFIADNRASGELAVQLAALEDGVGALQQAVAHLLAQGRDLDEIGAASYDTLNILGLTMLGYMWARIGAVSLAKLVAGDGNPDFFERKLVLGNYWAQREMPQVHALLAAARAGADTLMKLPAEAF